MPEKADGKRPGRPRSQEAHDSLINTTAELMETVPIRTITIEGIAKAAGVGKPTIYRWWDSKCDLVMDAFLANTAPQLPFTRTNDKITDISQHIEQLIKLLQGRTGKIIAEMVGEGQADPHILGAFRERFFLPLISSVRDALEEGIKSGEFDESLDPDLAVDLIYGPIYYRLLVGHEQIDLEFGRKIAARLPSLLAPQ